MASCSSLVVEMEKMPEGTNPSMERTSSNSKKTTMGRVPQWIKRLLNSMANRRQVLWFHNGKRQEEEEEAAASSSSWMQMAAEVKMLEKAMIEKRAEEGSALAKKAAPSSWPSSFRLQIELVRRFKRTNPSAPKAKGSMDVDEKDRSGGWVVEMERILERTSPCLEMERWKKPSIYRVPEWLIGAGATARSQQQAYRPQVVSLGPFHHGEPKLLPMEEHKCRLMLHMVKRSGKSLAEFAGAVEAIADRLQHAYDGLDEKWRGASTGRFVQMMVTDRGFLLETMTAITTGIPDDYHAVDDPVFSIRGMLSLMPRIRSDMCLVENQLPLLVLQTLEAVRSGTSPSHTVINKLVTDFLCPKLVEGISLEKGIVNLGLHPLDIFHKCFCGLSPAPKHQGLSCKRENTMFSAVKLREAGVHFRKSNTLSIRDIDFRNGVLRMPLVEVDDGTEKIFLDLIAFEQLHSNAGSDATDYMIFMDNIIDTEKDVALLRSKGVLKNFLSSDKEAAKLFNTLCRGAKLNPVSKVGHVQWMVAAHCTKPWNKWRAIFVQTYMSNPWVFISLVAAVNLLALTILQTVYTVADFYTKG